MKTPKFEITIVQTIGRGYDTWQRGVMGFGEILNQFCRARPDILQTPLLKMDVGDEYEWQRKPHNCVHFHRISQGVEDMKAVVTYSTSPLITDHKMLLEHQITLIIPGLRGVADALEVPGVIDKMSDDWIQLQVTITRDNQPL